MKFEYKRVENRLEVANLPKELEELGNDGWEIIWYYEEMMSPTTMLYRIVLKRPKKK